MLQGIPQMRTNAGFANGPSFCWGELKAALVVMQGDAGWNGRNQSYPKDIQGLPIMIIMQGNTPLQRHFKDSLQLVAFSICSWKSSHKRLKEMLVCNSNLGGGGGN